MNQSAWLEVSLLVDGELAEAVAEVLARYTSGGVVIESTQILADDEDKGQPVGNLRVYGYLSVGSELEKQRQKLEEGLWHLGQIRALATPQYRLVQEVDWAEAWKERFQPLRIGERLLIVPAWWEGESDPQRVVVRIDPGMAFGTGTHPTTQLCLEAIGSLLSSGSGKPAVRALCGPRDAEGCVLIDIGCGSGILAIAALKLGVHRALGVDVDIQAVEAARQNAALNGVLDRLETGVGSVEQVLAGEYSIRKAPLVVANILAPVLVRLLQGGMANLVTKGGFLILSGILEGQVEDVLRAAERWGLNLVAQRRIQDWVALVFSNK